MENTNLKSSTEQKGKTVTQILTFEGGIKKTIRGVITSSIQQGQYTKFDTTDGRLVMVNDNKILCIEVFSETPNSIETINPSYKSDNLKSVKKPFSRMISIKEENEIF